MHSKGFAVIPFIIVAAVTLITATVVYRNVNQRQTTSSKAASSLASDINNTWSTVKAINNIYPWSDGGPKASWESYIPSIGLNRQYVCNTKYCWTYDRTASRWLNDYHGFDMSIDSGYNVQPGPGNIYPWSNKGPTAAWTWLVKSDANHRAEFFNLPDGTELQETIICNKTICWRNIRYPGNPPAGTLASKWRDNGEAKNISTLNSFWTDTRVAGLWTGDGLTSAWTNPVSKEATLCNHSYCWTLNYSNWTWVRRMTSFPTGVSEFTSAWISQTTNWLYLCNAEKCWIKNASTDAYENNGVPVYLHIPPTPAWTPVPTNTPTPTPAPAPAPGNLKININATPSNYSSHPNFKWRRVASANNLPWNASGATESNVPVGTYTIEFQEVAGFTTPARITGVKISSGQTATATGTYALKVGNIKINIAASIPMGAQWRRVASSAVPWMNSGSTESSIPSGNVSIEFKPVAGYTTPASFIVTVPDGGTVEKTSDAYVSTTNACVPTLKTPANTTSITSNPTFEWSACPGSNVKYRIEVTGDSTPYTVNFVGITYTFTNPVPSWKAGQTYSWKVKVCPNPDCVGGTFSSVSKFTYASSTVAPARLSFRVTYDGIDSEKTQLPASETQVIIALGSTTLAPMNVTLTRVGDSSVWTSSDMSIPITSAAQQTGASVTIKHLTSTALTISGVTLTPGQQTMLNADGQGTLYAGDSDGLTACAGCDSYGAVDSLDLTNFLVPYRAGQTANGVDFDRNGTVNLGDFGLLAQNYQKGQQTINLDRQRDE